MKIIKKIRLGNAHKVLEVTKKELLELKDEYSFISVSEADLNNISQTKDNDIVGIICGDINNIDKIFDYANETVANPDCWFVFNPEKYGYKDNGKLNFGDAITALKKGYKVARKVWNGGNMWLILQPTTPETELRDGSVYKKAGLEKVQIDAHIDMFTAKGTMQPGWLASQADMLAEDWLIV